MAGCQLEGPCTLAPSLSPEMPLAYHSLVFMLKAAETWNAMHRKAILFFVQSKVAGPPIALLGGGVYGEEEELLVGATLSAQVYTEETNHTVILNSRAKKCLSNPSKTRTKQS